MKFIETQLPEHSIASLPAGAAGKHAVNDVHSKLNRTFVDGIVPVQSLEAIQQTVKQARRSGTKICIAGGRHAMGSQQFATGATLIDMTGFNRVLHLDQEAGLVELEAGIKWPELIDYLTAAQKGRDRQWGIIQKQTGADGLTLGGALAANIHGRGLQLKPIVADVESFVLVDQCGNAVRCSRFENSELFGLAIGGYGLFGVISHVTLRLAPRQRVQRRVEVLTADQLLPAFSSAIAGGALYGDFQFAIDNFSDDFLRRGILSTYHPAAADAPMPDDQRRLSFADWHRLVYLAHYDKAAAFAEYKRHYMATQGQIYWSDTHQLSTYLDDYHSQIDEHSAGKPAASEIITEIYVPREALPSFLDCVREDFRANSVDLIYGTIRLIEQDRESFLAWAREAYACIIFNLHTEHTGQGLERSASAFRRLIDLAIRFGGSYYLTYHKYATANQLLACHPRFPEFLEQKRKYDPTALFGSDWYCHYMRLLATSRSADRRSENG